MFAAQDREVYVSSVPNHAWLTGKEGRGRQPATPASEDTGSTGPNGEEEEEAIPDRCQGLRSGKQPVQEGPADKKRKRGAAASSHPRGGVQLKPIRRQYRAASDSDEDEEDRETLRERAACKATPASPIPLTEVPSPTKSARLEEETGRQTQSPAGHGDDEVPEPGQDVPAGVAEATLHHRFCGQAEATLQSICYTASQILWSITLHTLKKKKKPIPGNRKNHAKFTKPCSGKG